MNQIFSRTELFKLVKHTEFDEYGYTEDDLLEELDEITISVDVLGTPEPVSGLEELDPSRFGVIVKCGWRKGVLLPDLPGITTAEEQVRIARLKAGIGTEEIIELQRFEVKRYY